MRIGGEGCVAELDTLRGTHGSVLQSNRVLIDCEGRPTSWTTRRFSSAALERRMIRIEPDYAASA
jgi:hypothetical protein